MKSKQLSLTLLLLLAFILGACGPSAEQIATMTASAWTPTPKPTNTPPPTPTATPLPYDLTITVTDTNGQPIAGAFVIFPESGSDKPVVTDDAGHAVWTNLDGSNVSLTVTAQGYFKGEQGAALERGPNEVTVTLERDPFGLLPSDACGADETLLYAEDFQDGAVTNWGTYPSGAEIKILPDAAVEGNSFLSLDFGDLDGQFTINSIAFQADIVRRLKYRPGDHSRFHVGWGGGGGPDAASIEIVISADEMRMNLWGSGPAATLLGNGRPSMQQGVWHLLELVTRGETIELWVDGVLNISTNHAPLTQGSNLYFGSNDLPPESIVSLDDISFCGLGATFESMYVAP